MSRRWLLLLGSMLLSGAILPTQLAGSATPSAYTVYCPLVAKAPPPLVTQILAFVSNRDGHAEIYTMRGDGSQQTRLTFTTAMNRDPAWSPDGARIAFWSTRDGNSELYIMQADGTGLIRLTQTPTEEVHPTWAPNGDRLAFSAFPPGGGMSDLYTLQTDGAGLTRLTDHASDGLDHSDPTWSPDGTRIAFVSAPNLYVMPAGGGAPLRLTTTLSGMAMAIGQPSWSPDSQQLVFAFNPGNFPHDQPHLYMIRADGSEIQPRDLGVNDLPAWSPDGGRLAYMHPGAAWIGFKAGIGVMTIDGVQSLLLTTQEQGDNFEPSWAP